MDVRSSLPGIAWMAGCLIVGAIVGVFFVFRTLFTDGPADPWHPEYLVAHGLTVAVYLLAALVVVRFVPRPEGLWLAGVVLPGLVIIGVYTDASTALRAITAGALAIGTAAGALLGAWWRSRKGEAASSG